MKSVVLLSGGLDSTTLLAYVVKKYGAKNVIALSLFYGQKHKKELECAEKVAKHYNVSLKTFDVSQIFRETDCALLAGSSKSIPHNSYFKQLQEIGGQGTVKTYVPFRNGLFLSIASSIALSLNASMVFYGAHSDDAAGNAYPDCTLPFVYSMQDAIFEGSGQKLKLSAPFISKYKKDIVASGLELGVPYHLTWSCYEGGEKPCGVCGTCIDRKKAFTDNGTVDPLEYANE